MKASETLRPLELTLEEYLKRYPRPNSEWIVGVQIGETIWDRFDPLPEGCKLTECLWLQPEHPLLRSACEISLLHYLVHALHSLALNLEVADLSITAEQGFHVDVEGKHWTQEDLKQLESAWQTIFKAGFKKVWKRGSGSQRHAYVVSCYASTPYPSNQPFIPFETPKFLKIENLSGLYEQGQALKTQRIQGRFFLSQGALEAYEEQAKRLKQSDHRSLGKRMGLFHFQEESPGHVFWHAKGFRILERLKLYIREILNMNGYEEVLTPLLFHQKLWRASGHWEQFSENMFSLGGTADQFSIKPMSCPGHIQIYNQNLHSYRQLPIRMAEFGHCHRKEASGALHGLMRGMSFTQDDAHIFCTPEQLEDEIVGCIRLLTQLYATLGFEQFETKCSLRPEHRIGNEALWDRAEAILLKILKESELPFEIQPGEGAFYGPKLEFTLKDSLGRHWQCGTIQLDFSLPHRLGAKYIDAAGEAQVPVLIHRAFLGSLERFLGILLESRSGHLPFWLAPEQVVVLTVSPSEESYGQKIVKGLEAAGIQVTLDARNESVGLKVREAILQKVPYLALCGRREASEGTLTLRDLRGEQRSLAVEDAIQKLSELKASRASAFPSLQRW